MRCSALTMVVWILCLMLPVKFAMAAENADESVCIQCHGGLDGHLGDPVKDWQGSVHARNGVSCHDCHGGDPTDFAMAKNPDRGFIGAPDYEKVPEFCGRCHIGVLEDYQSSAHGKAVAEGGAQCVVCHGNHAVVEAYIGLINEESCTRCHDYGRAAEIKLAIKDTDAQIVDMEDELQRIHKLGFTTEDLEGALFSLRNQFRRVFHSVDVQRVRQETGSVQAELGKMRQKVEEIDTTLGKRKLWGSIVIVIIVLLGVVFLLVRKTYEEEETS